MWLCALVWASLAACPIWGLSLLPPMVDTTQGKVLGKYISIEGFERPVAVFLGVPFAKPPLGSLRFAPPEPVEPWSFVKDAISYPPMNPNGEELPHWPEYDQTEGYLQIGATTQQAQRLREEEVAFWNELLANNPPQTEHPEHTEHTEHK